MRITLTSSSGRVGRAIYNALTKQHQVIGIDRSPFSTTQIVADFANLNLLTKTMQGADAVIHSAALHAPHVGLLFPMRWIYTLSNGFYSYVKLNINIQHLVKKGIQNLVVKSTFQPN